MCETLLRYSDGMKNRWVVWFDEFCWHYRCFDDLLCIWQACSDEVSFAVTLHFSGSLEYFSNYFWSSYFPDSFCIENWTVHSHWPRRQGHRSRHGPVSCTVPRMFLTSVAYSLPSSPTHGLSLIIGYVPWLLPAMWASQGQPFTWFQGDGFFFGVR